MPETLVDRRDEAWNRILPKAAGRLSEAVQAFESLLQTDANDVAAWYNLALTHAWAGHHPAAIDALNQYVQRETDEEKSANAWTLAEVLLCGQGMEEEANWVEHSIIVPLSDPNTFVNTFLVGQEKQGLLVGTRVDREAGVLTAIFLEPPRTALTVALEAEQPMRFGGNLILGGGMVRIASLHKEIVDGFYQSMREQVGSVLGEPIPARGPGKFPDIPLSYYIFPRSGVGTQEELDTRLRAHLEKEFEEAWIHRPVHSLGGVAPIGIARSICGMCRTITRLISAPRRSDVQIP